MLSKFWLYLTSGLLVTIGVLSTMLSIRASKIDDLTKDLETEKSNNDKLDSVIDSLNVDNKTKAKSNEIHETNSLADSDVINDRLSKYTRD